MKLCTACVAGILASLFLMDAGAQESVPRRNGLLRQWAQKKRDERKIEAVAKDVTTQSDIAYLSDDEPLHKLDVYLPAKKDAPLTVLVHIHGGGWEIGDKSLMKATGLFFASQGVLFIAPNYRLSPKAQHPAHIDDCAAAVAWAFRHAKDYGGNPQRIFVSGHSAGAHLAALLATDPAYLQKFGLKTTDLAGVIPVDAATYDLTDSANEGIVKKFIRESFGTDPMVWKTASPLTHLSKEQRYPKFLILNTTNRASAAKGAKAFADAFVGIGGNAQFIPVANHTHGEMATGMYSLADPVGQAIHTFLTPPASN